MNKNPTTEKLGKVALDNRYWYGAASEMVRLELATEFKPKVFEVKLPLPEKDALAKLVLQKLYTKPLGDWYDDAKADEEALKDEMTEWRDNMDGSGLENTSKFEEVSECADSMESQDLPDVPDSLKDIPVTVPPGVLIISARNRRKRHRTGRDARHSENLGILDAVRDALRERIEKMEGDDPTDKEAERTSEAEDFYQEVDNYFDAVEGVSFPGMY